MMMKLSRAASVALVTLLCTLALSMGLAGQVKAAHKAPGLRPAPARMTWLKDASVSPLVYAYPSSFDLRTLGKVSPVKDQGRYGTCWAFAALGSLESSLLPEEEWNFSEDNLVYFSGFDFDPQRGRYDTGGNSYMAAAYLARWSGPFSEAQDPYRDGSHPAPSTLTLQQHVQDVVFLPPRNSALDNNDIKYALTTWGGVNISYYDRAASWAGATPATRCYYYGGSAATSPNHAVLLVGWDDDYPRDNFVTAPPGDGAFLVKNSWGTSPPYDDGYFWLSYYDAVAAYDDSSAVFRAEPTTDYSRNYQHDPLGFVSYFEPSSLFGRFASRFVAGTSDDLTAVGFWTLGQSASYTVYAGKSLADLKPSGSGTLPDFGYHTVRLETPFQLVQGRQFYVAVDLAIPSYRGQRVPEIALESRLAKYSSGAKATRRQSFVEYRGEWSDLLDLSPDLANANVCLKAFTGGMDGPHTTVTDADTKWHNAPVMLTFTGTAPAGVTSTEYSLDNGANWTPVQADGTYTVEAPSDHSNDGVHTIQYRSIDTSGTVETPHSVTVKIDTTRPETKARGPYTVRRYGYVNLRYRANDGILSAGTATVTIRVKTLGGVTKLKFSLGAKATNTTLTKRFRCSLPRGKYRFFVYAVDPAENTQYPTGRNTLTVS